MKSNWLMIFGAVLLHGTFCLAQEDAEKIYDGNKFFHSGKLPQASAAYSAAKKLNPSNSKASFNLGDALYKNGVYIRENKITDPAFPKVTPDSIANMAMEEAIRNFEFVANTVSNKDTLHRAWHNIGNCYLQRKDYPAAVNSYKKALRYDPKDEDSRYNLAYALKHMPKEQSKSSASPQNQPQDPKEQKKEQQQTQMSREQAEQLMKALNEAERKLQDKRKQKQQDLSKSQGKDW